MKEILFRGKRVDNDKWVEGIPYNECIICGDKIACEIIPETVGQYIGMVDKNGKKIFEGDILCVHTDIVTVVKYNEYRAAFIRENPMFIYNFLHIDSDDVEVIGNIHDNPELLGGIQ